MTTNKRCPICCIYHAPKCQAVPQVWPAATLLERHDLAWRPRPSDMPELLDDVTADRWAVRLGLHPEQVWPGWCEAALTYGDRVFIEEGGWRQAWEWAESQRCDLPAGNPLRGQGDPGTLRGRENANEAVIVGRGERVA